MRLSLAVHLEQSIKELAILEEQLNHDGHWQEELIKLI